MVTYRVVLIFTIALSYANAALLVNVINDDIESSNRLELPKTACEADSCDKLCRLLGFTDGICVGGNCKCERKEVKGDVMSAPVSDCNYQACDQLCRRLGFPGGACVGDRCKCDNFKKILGDESSDPVGLVGDCNYQACDQLCRRLGFPGGACVGDRCKCDNFKQVLEALVAALGSCSLLECEQRCRRIGFPGGACVNDRCKCDILRDDHEKEIQQDTVPIIYANQAVHEDEEQSENDEVNMRSSTSRASCDCNPRSCDYYCFRKHYIGGICVTGSCRCYK